MSMVFFDKWAYHSHIVKTKPTLRGVGFTKKEEMKNEKETDCITHGYGNGIRSHRLR